MKTKTLFAFLCALFAINMIHSMGFAKSMNDVSKAECEGPNGSFVRIDAAAKSISGKFGDLSEVLSNSQFGEEMFLEIQNNFPSSGLTGLGSLVAGSNYFGNMSLVVPSNLALTEIIELSAIFVDLTGASTSQPMNCLLKFF